MGGDEKAQPNKLAERLHGAQFRWLNERLYTTTGHEALELFSADPQQYDLVRAGLASAADLLALTVRAGAMV